MDLQPCLPDPALLALHAVTVRPEVVWLDVHSQADSGCCPRCGWRSARRHSHYMRVLKDLALLGWRVRLRLTVHKFFCGNRSCPQRVFCERLPTVAGPWQRQTLRLAAQDTAVALEVGAESGARVLARCGCPVGADALLALIRRVPAVPLSVRHLGVDDWAWRKGHTYGTVLVDLDGRRVVDLLPNRETSTLAGWLLEHPEVELITRDRASAYSEGASRGAPQAQQVADRWHLLKNLRETLERYLGRVHHVFVRLVQTGDPPAGSVAAEPAPEPAPPCAQQAPTPRQVARFAAIRTLLDQGRSVSAVAREVGVSRRTVRKYVHMDQHPGSARRAPRRQLLDPYRDWLTEQVRAGQRNAVQLFRILRQQGYQGGYTTVKSHCHTLRHAHPVRPGRWACPSPQALSWAVLGRGAAPSPEVQTLLDAARGVLPEFVRVEQLLKTGWALLRGRADTGLAAWLGALSSSGIRELRAFAVGVDRDFDAVRAALETAYSNGPVEGHVNRLKTLKRSMYGRAGLDLLRARLLYQPGRRGRHQKAG